MGTCTPALATTADIGGEIAGRDGPCHLVAPGRHLVQVGQVDPCGMPAGTARGVRDVAPVVVRDQVQALRGDQVLRGHASEAPGGARHDDCPVPRRPCHGRSSHGLHGDGAVGPEVAGQLPPGLPRRVLGREASDAQALVGVGDLPGPRSPRP